MFGGIIGDVVGSTRERHPLKTKKFLLVPEGSRFTDDTVMLVATAYSILTGLSYAKCYKKFGRKYINAGYGKSFKQWLESNSYKPYNSWGNGSAMRVAPIGWAFNNIKDVLSEAKKSAMCTHNHPEGIKGAQAVALCVYYARKGKKLTNIKYDIANRFNYDLNRSIEDIRRTYKFDVSCQGSVPESLISFFDSNNFEDSIRNAVSIGGDADTQASIAGAIAEAFYNKASLKLTTKISEMMPKEFLEIIVKFYEKYII